MSSSLPAAERRTLAWRRRLLAAAVAFSVLLVSPTPVQASWTQMFFKVLEQINQTMGQFERITGRLEDHLNTVSGVVGTYRSLYSQVRYLGDLRPIGGIWDHMRADPYSIARGMVTDQQAALEMYALGNARRWLRPCTASYLVPCSQTGFTVNMLQRFAYGNRAGAPGVLASLDRSGAGAYNRAGMPAGPMANYLDLFNNVWHDGRALQRRFEWNVHRTRDNTRRISALVDGTRLSARQLFSFANDDIDDISDGDGAFRAVSGSGISDYVAAVHSDPCGMLPDPELDETTVAAQLTRMECAGPGLSASQLVTEDGEWNLSQTEMETMPAVLAIHRAGMTAQRLELEALEAEARSRERVQMMEADLRRREKRLRVMDCYAQDGSLPHLVDRFGNCATGLTAAQVAAARDRVPTAAEKWCLERGRHFTNCSTGIAALDDPE